MVLQKGTIHSNYAVLASPCLLLRWSMGRILWWPTESTVDYAHDWCCWSYPTASACVLRWLHFFAAGSAHHQQFSSQLHPPNQNNDHNPLISIHGQINFQKNLIDPNVASAKQNILPMSRMCAPSLTREWSAPLTVWKRFFSAANKSENMWHGMVAMRRKMRQQCLQPFMWLDSGWCMIQLLLVVFHSFQHHLIKHRLPSI